MHVTVLASSFQLPEMSRGTLHVSKQPVPDPMTAAPSLSLGLITRAWERRFRRSGYR